MTYLYIVLGVFALVAFYVALAYNSLVTVRNKVKSEWANIDVQLKRRFDLIPNLIKTVKGYASHEKETLEKIVELRNKYQNAKTSNEQIETNNEITSSIFKVLALAEHYPELKANENFKELQVALRDTEDKIAHSKQSYNDAVYMYNNKIEKFPTNIVANLFGFKSQTFLKTDESEKENVKVEF